MFKDYDCFELKSDLPGVPAGSVGVVLMVYGGQPCAYEVEFTDGDGGNMGDEITFTITEDQMVHRDG
jgi:hypothetical protein